MGVKGFVVASLCVCHMCVLLGGAGEVLCAFTEEKTCSAAGRGIRGQGRQTRVVCLWSCTQGALYHRLCAMDRQQ